MFKNIRNILVIIAGVITAYQEEEEEVGFTT